MPERQSQRRRPGRAQAPAAPLHEGANPVLTLQRWIGNRGVNQVIARTPTRTGTVEIAGVGKVKVKGGNLDDWAGTDVYYTVDLTSEKGKHSKKLEKLASSRDKVDVTVMIAPGYGAGEDLNVGGGTQLTIKDARVTKYAVQDGVETWAIGDFTDVKRKKIVRKIGAG